MKQLPEIKKTDKQRKEKKPVPGSWEAVRKVAAEAEKAGITRHIKKYS